MRAPQGLGWSSTKSRWSVRELLESQASHWERENSEGLLAAVWGKIPERDHLSPSQVWKVISSRGIYRPHPALGHQPESPSHQSISCGFESGCFSLQNLHCILYGSSESASPSPWSDPLSQGTNSGLLLCQTPTEFIMKPFSHLKKKSSSLTHRT